MSIYYIAFFCMVLFLSPLYTRNMDLEHQGITPNYDRSQNNELDPGTTPASDNFDDSEAALHVLAKMIARRHIRNQLNKSDGRPNEYIINDDSNGKTSKG